MSNEVAVEISNASFPEKLEIQEEVKKFLDKFQRLWKISRLKINVDTYSPKGRKKYSMHAQAVASDILFNVKSSSWDVPSTLDLLFERLSKKIGKELKKKQIIS